MTERPTIVGENQISPPYPLRLKGLISKGFGRGSKELGIPTANLPSDVSESVSTVLSTGIYYGYASVGTSPETWAMVMSYGWNPFYKNEKRTAEIHIINEFPDDFYDQELRIVVLGYIRPELNYTTKDALIDDIKFDIAVAVKSLDRSAFVSFKTDSFLLPSC